jgi:hypothetical protein
MQCDGQFDHAQAGAEVAADCTHRFHQVRAQLFRDRGQLGFGNARRSSGRAMRDRRG